MQKFEYRSERFSVGGFFGTNMKVSRFDHLINKFGADGWELFLFAGKSYGVYFTHFQKGN